MSSRFLELGGDGGADLSILQTGSFSINVANIIDQSLTPNLPVVTNGSKVLTSRLITLADLDFVPITNPNQGDLTIIGNLIAENVISNNLNLNNFAQQTNADIILLNDKTQNITAVSGITTMTSRLQINTPANQPSLIMQGRLVQFGGVSIPTFDIIADRPGGVPDAETINLINYRAATDLNTNALIARISMLSVGNITNNNFGSEYAIQTCNFNTNDVTPRFKIGADNTTYITGNLNISAELTMNNNRIKLIADPIDDTDAASKIYVDGLTFGLVRNPMIDFLDCNGFDILGTGIMECKSVQLNGDFIHTGTNQPPIYVAQYNSIILNNDTIFQANYNTNSGVSASVLIKANGNHSIANTACDYTISTCLQNNIDLIERFRISADNKIYISSVLDMNNNHIQSIANPINNNDAVNKIYVDNNLSNVVRNPMTDNLFGGGFGITDVPFIECDSLIVFGGGFEINSSFLQKKTTSSPFFQSIYEKIGGVLNGDEIFRSAYSISNLRTNARINIVSIGNQTAVNGGCDYILQTCISGSIIPTNRLRIAADNNTYINGGLIIDNNRIQSIADPIDNNDAANKIYVDNNLSNVVRNPMQIDLDGGGNGMFGITFIEANSLELLQSLNLTGSFVHRRTGTSIFYQSIYDKFGGILNDDFIYRARYSSVIGDSAAISIKAAGDQTSLNIACDYTIRTCLQNTSLTVDRFRIAADNNTYINGGLIIDNNRIQSIADPIDNNDAANKLYVDNSVKQDWDVIPVLLGDGLLPTGSRDHYINMETPYKISISQIMMRITSQGSSPSRVAIYRGSNTAAILVGQSLNTPAAQLTLPYFKYTIIPEIGQNLTFQKNEDIVIAFAISGNVTRFAGISTNNDISTSWTNNSNSVASGFPLNPQAKGAALTILPCVRLIAN